MTHTRPFVRPARLGDLEPLLDVARAVRGGLSSLPADAERLGELVELSTDSFGRQISEPGGEHYLFVVEEEGNLLGAAALIARVGGYDPFYTYEARTEHFSHPPLGVEKDMTVLHLKKEHKGPSELAGLTLVPYARARGLGRLLSLSRLLYIAMNPQRFDTRIIAEHRGLRDGLGRSPFWDWVGQRFFEREFAEVHFLCGLGHKEFIADLMPSYPIYVDLLPSEVAASIGECRRELHPARELLEREGFRPSGEVDIFEAGPILEADVASLRTVSAARTGRLGERGQDVGPRQLVAVSGPEFRCCAAPVTALESGGVGLSPDVYDVLSAGVGDTVAWSPEAQAASEAEPLTGEPCIAPS